MQQINYRNVRCCGLEPCNVGNDRKVTVLGVKGWDGGELEWQVAFNQRETRLKMLLFPLKDDVYSSSCTETIKIKQRDWLKLTWGKKRNENSSQNIHPVAQWSLDKCLDTSKQWNMNHSSFFSEGEKRLWRVCTWTGAVYHCMCPWVWVFQRRALLNFSCISNEVTLNINIWRCQNLFDQP